MANLLEVVFENINKHDVIQLLMNLVFNAKEVVSVECSENIALVENGKLSKNHLESVLQFNGDVCVSIKLRDMSVSDFTLPITFVRLVKYDDKYDIDFSFDIRDIGSVNRKSFIKYLHDYAIKVIDGLQVENFFGGIEPASDEDTRYFTNQTLAN